MDLTHALEAAAKAAYEAHDPDFANGVTWEQVKQDSPMLAFMYRNMMLPGLNAAVPHLEAGLMRSNARYLREQRFGLPADLLDLQARKVEEIHTLESLL